MSLYMMLWRSHPGSLDQEPRSGWRRPRGISESAMRLTVSSTLALLISTGAVFALPTEEIPTSEPAYLAKVKTAAPKEIVDKASIIMMQDGKPKSLQTGTNGFTCMIGGDGTPLCADENAMAWRKAAASKSDPPNKVGFIYMLAGDTGTNNAVPEQRASHQHWVQTGPHVMIVGPMVREMAGYPRTADVADPKQPYVMAPGTPYEHLMLPVE
jgi:hypothetical protein